MFGRSVRLVVRTHRGLAVAWLVGVVVQSLLVPGFAFLGKLTADAAIARDGDAVVRWILCELAIAVGTILAARLALEARMLLRTRLRLEAHALLADRIGARSLAELDDPGLLDRFDRARYAADTGALTLINEALSVLRGLISLVGYAILLSAFSPWALLLLVIIVPGAVVEWRRSRAHEETAGQLARDQRTVRYLRDTILSEPLAAENRLYGVVPRFADRATAIGARIARAELRSWLRSLPASLAGQLLPALVVNVVYLGMAVLTVRGELTIGELTLYGMSFTGVQGLATTILLSLRAVIDGREPLRALFDLIDEVPARLTGGVVAGADRTLRLSGVGYRYPGASAWALRGIDLEIAPGDFVAIVGGNGDGKSTLLKLLCGLLTPIEGAITFGGVPLSAWDPAALRAQLAVVFQDFARYPLTAGANATLGADPAQLAAAARASAADEVIADLPLGAETELLPGVPGGVGLSGGQWQRLALARCLARTEARVLLLDEPMSAIDKAAEQRILAELRARQGERAIVMITHDRGALRPTDKIVTLERGELVLEPVARGADRDSPRDAIAL
jgi:ABC-type bacteriocin/lantibiotic exporter with double-glycine peptidase domain